MGISELVSFLYESVWLLLLKMSAQFSGTTNLVMKLIVIYPSVVKSTLLAAITGLYKLSESSYCAAMIWYGLNLSAPMAVAVICKLIIYSYGSVSWLSRMNFISQLPFGGQIFPLTHKLSTDERKATFMPVSSNRLFCGCVGSNLTVACVSS